MTESPVDLNVADTHTHTIGFTECVHWLGGGGIRYGMLSINFGGSTTKGQRGCPETGPDFSGLFYDAAHHHLSLLHLESMSSSYPAPGLPE